MSDMTPCLSCQAPTDMLGTKLCDQCWSLRSALSVGVQPAAIVAAIFAAVPPPDLVTIRDALTAAIDAPRLAARETPTVVATAPWRYGEGDVQLVATDYGEQSVRKASGGHLMRWVTSRDAEWLFQSIRKETPK